jgi:hypothetical protein
MLNITYNPDLMTESGKTMTKLTLEFDNQNEPAIQILMDSASSRMGAAVATAESSDVSMIERVHAAVPNANITNYGELLK